MDSIYQKQKIMMTNTIKLALVSTLTTLAFPAAAIAGSVTVTINLTSTQGIGPEVGKITLEDTGYGLILTPDLANIVPGAHGFHVHENPSCEPAEKDGKIVPGLAAGGHYDPLNSGYHGGPYQDGHLGDLPPLFADKDGNSTIPVLAPRLNVANVLGRSLMIHFHGDNFSDDPKPLGGGGPRLACGVIPATVPAS